MATHSDIEKHPQTFATWPTTTETTTTNDASFVDSAHAVPGSTFTHGNTLYARIQRLAGRLAIEQRGIERVPPSERTDTGFKALLNVSTMWLAANMVVSSFALGLLAQNTFHLGVADAMLIVLFFNLLGITPVCYFSTFGPRFGLRQMVLSRYWFGWYGVKLSTSPSPPSFPLATPQPRLTRQ